MKIFSSATLFLALIAANATSVVGQTCLYTTRAEPNSIVTPHQVLLLTDPQNEQQVYFDLYWGGAIVEYLYQGTSYVYNGHLDSTESNGYLAQFSMDCCTNGYNPTQAGALHKYPSPVTGATCGTGGSATVWSNMLDFNQNLSNLAPAFGVFNGTEELAGIYGDTKNGYFTPYTIQTIAQWVPTNVGNSAAGIPFYYLKLSQTVTNVGTVENYPWAMAMSVYVEPIFPSVVGSPASCLDVASACSDTTKPLVGGTYTSSALTKGIASGVGAGSGLMTSFNAKWFNTLPPAGSQHHMVFFFEAVTPGQQRTFNWYLMTGPWANALSFMQTHS